MDRKSASDITVLDATRPLDVDQLFPLIRVLWDSVPDTDSNVSDETVREDYGKSLDSGRDSVRILWPVGYASDTNPDYARALGMWRAKPWPPDKEHPTSLHLMDIVVMPSVRGHGYGKLLMEDFLDYAKRVGYEHALSRTHPANGLVNGLHRACGFAVHSEPEGSIVWKKSLS